MAHSRFNANVNFFQPHALDFYKRLNSVQLIDTKLENEQFELPGTIINKYNNNINFQVFRRLKYI